MANQDFARAWLRRNGYNVIADMIETIMAEWKVDGKSTRRNWFEILAGNKLGNKRVAGGRAFPIIASVRQRQGLPSTPNAITSPEEKESPPPIRPSARWSGRRLKS
jgi:hypothetical protein